MNPNFTYCQRIDTNSYDAAGREISTRDAVGYSTVYTLDRMGRGTATQDPLGFASHNVYDKAGQLLDAIDNMGADTNYQYNLRGELTVTTDALGNAVANTLDAAGNVTRVTDPLGHATNYTIDALGRASQVTDPLQHSTLTTWWADGAVHTVTDPRGTLTTSTSDYVNRQITTAVSAPSYNVVETSTQSLNADGAVTSETDPLNHSTTYTLNAVSAVTGVTDANGHTSSNVLDGEGRVTQAIDALGKSTTYTLDPFGNAIKTTDATGRVSQQVFDSLNHLVVMRDGLGDPVHFNYDAVGNVISQADGSFLGWTSRRFDGAGRVIALTDPDNNQTSWEYDQAGHKTKEIDPIPGGTATQTWTYDTAGRMTGHVDQLGRSELYTYLNNNLLQSEVWKDPTGTVVNTQNWTYNENGQVLTAGDVNGTYTFTYDPLGRLATQNDVWNLTLSYTWDAANRLTNIADSLGGNLATTLDAADRVTDRTFTNNVGAQASVHYAYNNADLLTGSTRYSNAAQTISVGSTVYANDDAHRVTAITHKNAANNNIDQITYAYDAAGRIASDVSSSIGYSAMHYTYDSANQLVGDGTSSIKYDHAGNRTSLQVGSTVIPYTTTAANEMASDRYFWNYSYDAAGELTLKTRVPGAGGDAWKYAYDNLGRLVKAEYFADYVDYPNGPANERIQFKYDVLGNRTQKTVDSTGAGTYVTVTDYAYDRNGNAWADLDGNAGNALQTRRLYGDAMDQLWAKIGAAGVNWYLTDIIGSVRDIAGSNGNLLEHRDWDGFGRPLQGPSSDRYGYTGREFDTEIDLQYNRARYFDPETSRWQTQDPLGFDAGDSNLYRYVKNSPANAVDPTGKIIFTRSRNTAQDLDDWFRGRDNPFPGHKSPGIETKIVEIGDLFFIVPNGPLQLAKAKELAQSPEWKGNKWISDLLSLDKHIICQWERNAQGNFGGWDFRSSGFTIPPNESKDSVAIYTRPIEEWWALDLGLLIPHKFVGVTNSDGTVKTYSFNGTDWHVSAPGDTRYVNWFRRCSLGYTISDKVSAIHLAIAHAYFDGTEVLGKKGDICWAASVKLLWEAHKLAGGTLITSSCQGPTQTYYYPNGNSEIRGENNLTNPF